MPDVNFHAFARQRAQILLDDVGTEIADAARTQLDVLRAEVDARIGGLQEALASQDHKARLDRLVKELSAAARDEGDARLEDARVEAARQAVLAREEADARLAAARAEATAHAEAAQSVNAALLGTVDEARGQLRAAAAAQEEAAHARELVEKRLAQVQAEHAASERLLADARGEASTARSERDVQIASVTQAQEQIRKLEQEQNRLRLTCNESGKILEVQIRRASELAGELETIRAEASVARKDADARHHDLELASERIRALESERRKLDETSEGHSRTVREREGEMALLTERIATLERERKTLGDATQGQRRAAQEREDDVVLKLGRVVVAAQAIQRASSANEVLDILIEQLSADFDRAAIFLAGPTGVKGLRGHGFGEGSDLSAVLIPRTSDSPVIRAMADRQPIEVEGGAAPDIGLPRGPIARAVALPVISGGKVIAVAYAEDLENSSRIFPGIGCKIAEILIDHASRRLTTKRAQSATSARPDANQLDADSDARQNGHRPAASSAATRAETLVGRAR